MNYKPVFILFLVVNTGLVKSRDLFQFYEKGKVGFRDSYGQSGKAWVLKNEMAYYIDKTGRFIKKAEEQTPNVNTPDKESD